MVGRVCWWFKSTKLEIGGNLGCAGELPYSFGCYVINCSKEARVGMNIIWEDGKSTEGAEKAQERGLKPGSEP